MTVDFLQIDVFAEEPMTGNPLAVFPDAAELTGAQMQTIASEMNLSETTFVTGVTTRGYDVRIFMPRQELPFAGHPTIGTAWALRHLGKLSGDSFVQRSGAGETVVTTAKDALFFERTGAAGMNLPAEDQAWPRHIAKALGLQERDMGLEARELGRSGRLYGAFSEAGLRHLMVPLSGLPALESVRIDPAALREVSPFGAYCFTASQAGRVRARGFFPAEGVAEDPATGSAAACLGIYLADRLGPMKLEVFQGQEIGRPSRMLVDAHPGRVRVGGTCRLALSGRLAELP